MKKSSLSTLLLSLISIVYLLVSVITVIITGVTTAFWLGFGFFTWAAIVAICVSLLFGKQYTIRDIFFNAPIFYVGGMYFIASGIFSVLHMYLGLLPFKWMLVVQLVIFAVFAVDLVFAIAGKVNAENVTAKVAIKNDFLRDMTTQLNTVAQTCPERGTKQQLEKLAEEFQYSKPCSDAALEAIEKEIRRNVQQLLYADSVELAAQVSKIRNMLIQRNSIAKTVDRR